MKKIINIFLCLTIMALSFTGCSGSSNELTEENVVATINTSVKALQEFDTKQLRKYVNSPTLSIILGYAEKHKQFQDLGKAIFKNLNAEVKSIDINNKTAIVSVSNKNLYAAAQSFASNLKAGYSTLDLIRKLNDEAFLDEKLGALLAEIEKAPMSDNPVEIELSIDQSSKNLIVNFNDTAENAVSGGALDAIKNIYQ